MQYFKGDARELKFYNSVNPLLDQLSLQKDLFFEGAFEAMPLGDVISDTERSPLANAIKKEIFRTSFKQIFDAFVEVGTFEAYITVFKKIFGEDVEITFTVPGAGELEIEIEASGLEVSDILARYIEDEEYVFDEVIDDEADNIAFRTLLGFTSQYELEQMLYELVPNGIFTTITLTI